MPDSSVTKSAIAMGSPLYMAPEQMASSRDVDARADVWSLGATMYELLSGRPPFDAPNVLALAALLRETEAEPLSRVRPDLPAELCAIVMRCLTKDPSLRFASGAEVGAALTGDSATFARHVEPFVSTRIMSSNPDFGASADGLQKTQRAPSNVASAAGTAPEPTEAPRERRSFRGPFGALAVGGVVLGVALFVGWRFEKTDSRSPVTASASASAPEPAVPTVAIRKTDSPDSPVASVETPIPSSTPAPPKTPPSAVVHGPSARPAASSHAPSKPSAPVPILPPRL